MVTKTPEERLKELRQQGIPSDIAKLIVKNEFPDYNPDSQDSKENKKLNYYTIHIYNEKGGISKTYKVDESIAKDPQKLQQFIQQKLQQIAKEKPISMVNNQNIYVDLIDPKTHKVLNPSNLKPIQQKNIEPKNITNENTSSFVYNINVDRPKLDRIEVSPEGVYYVYKDAEGNELKVKGVVVEEHTQQQTKKVPIKTYRTIQQENNENTTTNIQNNNIDRTNLGFCPYNPYDANDTSQSLQKNQPIQQQEDIFSLFGGRNEEYQIDREKINDLNYKYGIDQTVANNEIFGQSQQQEDIIKKMQSYDYWYNLLSTPSRILHSVSEELGKMYDNLFPEPNPSDPNYRIIEFFRRIGKGAVEITPYFIPFVGQWAAGWDIGQLLAKIDKGEISKKELEDIFINPEFLGGLLVGYGVEKIRTVEPEGMDINIKFKTTDFSNHPTVNRNIFSYIDPNWKLKYPDYQEMVYKAAYDLSHTPKYRYKFVDPLSDKIKPEVKQQLDDLAKFLAKLPLDKKEALVHAIYLLKRMKVKDDLPESETETTESTKFSSSQNTQTKTPTKYEVFDKGIKYLDETTQEKTKTETDKSNKEINTGSQTLILERPETEMEKNEVTSEQNKFESLNLDNKIKDTDKKVFEYTFPVNYQRKNNLQTEQEKKIDQTKQNQETKQSPEYKTKSLYKRDYVIIVGAKQTYRKIEPPKTKQKVKIQIIERQQQKKVQKYDTITKQKIRKIEKSKNKVKQEEQAKPIVTPFLTLPKSKTKKKRLKLESITPPYSASQDFFVDTKKLFKNYEIKIISFDDFIKKWDKMIK